MVRLIARGACLRLERRAGIMRVMVRAPRPPLPKPPTGSRSRGARGGARGLAVLASALTLLACGPSVQSIYEGAVRFEHCYRLDLDLNIASSHREMCWKQWLTQYTYGQPRDRIEYARRRARAFASGDSSRPLLALGSAATPRRRDFPSVVPEPTSAHASPPPIAAPVSVEAGPPPSGSAGVPGASCAAGCTSSWERCEAACRSGGAISESACKSCDPDYRRCMKRCFE